MIIDINIRTVMLSGQVFSYEEYEDKYKVYSADKMCLAYPTEEDVNKTEVLCRSEDEAYWRNYFNSDQGRAFEKELTNTSNLFIAKCMKYGTGSAFLFSSSLISVPPKIFDKHI